MLHICLPWMAFAFPYSRKQTNYNSEQIYLNVNILALIIRNEKKFRSTLLRVSNVQQKCFASKQTSL